MTNTNLPLTYDSAVYRFDAQDLDWPGESWQLFTQKINKTFTHVTKAPNNTTPITIWIRTSKRYNYVTELLVTARNNAIRESDKKANSPTIELTEQTFSLHLPPGTFDDDEELDRFIHELKALPGVETVNYYEPNLPIGIFTIPGDFDPNAILALLEQA